MSCVVLSDSSLESLELETSEVEIDEVRAHVDESDVLALLVARTPRGNVCKTINNGCEADMLAGVVLGDIRFFLADSSRIWQVLRLMREGG